MDAALLLCPDLALRLPDTTERSMADACKGKITVNQRVFEKVTSNAKIRRFTNE